MNLSNLILSTRCTVPDAAVLGSTPSTFCFTAESLSNQATEFAGTERISLASTVAEASIRAETASSQQESLAVAPDSPTLAEQSISASSEFGGITDDTRICLGDGRQLSALELSPEFNCLTWDEASEWTTHPARKWGYRIEPIVHLQTRDGREIRTSVKHAFWTPRGWACASTLKVGDRVGIARGAPPGAVPVDEALAWTLGKHLGASSLKSTRHSSPQNTGAGLSNLDLEADCFDASQIPGSVFCWSEAGLAAFASGLLEAKAKVYDGRAGCQVVFASLSHQFAVDLQAILLRLRVASRKNKGWTRLRGEPQLSWNVCVSGESLTRLSTILPQGGPKAESLKEMRPREAADRFDIIPSELIERFGFTFTRRTPRYVDEKDKRRRKRGYRREKILCRVEPNSALYNNCELGWDEVTHIAREAPARVWLVEVEGTQCIIGDDFITHNCADDQLAGNLLQELGTHITDNKLLHEVFPDLKPSTPWTKTQLTVQRDVILNDPTVQCESILGGSTGPRSGIAADTLVITSKGLKSADQIEEHDRVLSADGRFHRIIAVSSHEYVGEIIQIRPQGVDLKFSLTPDHPILICRAAAPGLPNTSRMRADELRKSDFLAFPRGQINSTHKIFQKPEAQKETSDFWQHLEVWKLLGLYLGDGWVGPADDSRHRNRVVFAFNALKDDHITVDAMRCGDVIGARVTASRRNNAMEVALTHPLLAKLCRLIGCGSHEKRIPAWIQRTSIERQIEFAKGYLLSDGCDTAEDIVCWTSCNPSVLVQLQTMIAGWGVWCQLQRSDRGGTLGQILGKKPFIQSDLYHLITKHPYVRSVLGLKHRQVTREILSDYDWWVTKTHVFVPVTSIKRTDFRGKVCQLTVESQWNLCVPGATLHDASFVTPLTET